MIVSSTKKLYKVLLLLSVFGILFIILLQVTINNWWIFVTSFHETTTILWWTSFDVNGHLKYCGNNVCYFTSDKNLTHNPATKALMFYGSHFNCNELPIPRHHDHIWALLHEESPRNKAMFLNEDFIKLFNVSATFSRYSNFSLTTQHLESFESLIDDTHFIPVEEKNKLLKDLSPVLYIQSNCDTFCDRDSYVSELMKYIPVDSYGECLNNKQLPYNLRINSGYDYKRKDEFNEFVARYKFTIAIENAVCDDYITEKLWRSLVVGSIPVYAGAPNIRDWLPHPESAILIQDFSSPKDLAVYIDAVNNNDTLYKRHVVHKTDHLANTKLRTVMKQRSWTTLDSQDENNFISSYECYVCDLVHQFAINKNRGNINGHHYKCSPPVSLLTMKKNNSNSWNNDLKFESCKGKLISTLINNNDQKLFTSDVMINLILKMKLEGQC